MPLTPEQFNKLALKEDLRELEEKIISKAALLKGMKILKRN